jgi:hypothetical protein
MNINECYGKKSMKTTEHPENAAQTQLDNRLAKVKAGKIRLVC